MTSLVKYDFGIVICSLNYSCWGALLRLSHWTIYPNIGLRYKMSRTQNNIFGAIGHGAQERMKRIIHLAYTVERVITRPKSISNFFVILSATRYSVFSINGSTSVRFIGGQSCAHCQPLYLTAWFQGLFIWNQYASRPSVCLASVGPQPAQISIRRVGVYSAAKYEVDSSSLSPEFQYGALPCCGMSHVLASPWRGLA